MKKTGLQDYRKNFIKFLSVFMVVFPWITYLNLYPLNEVEQMTFKGYNGMVIDFFVQQKIMVLILATVVSVIWFLGERVLPRKVDKNIPLIQGKNKWLFTLSGIFVAGTLISTIFSEYQKNAFSGSPTEGEGVWVLLCYLILILMFYNNFANEYAFEMAKKAVVVMSGITIILTYLEWFYKPLLEITWLHPFLAPARYADLIASMKSGVFSSSISVTFYNPGYFGGFVCLLLPFVLSFFLQAEKLKEKIMYGALVAGLMFSVTTANTTTALYIAILEVLAILAISMVGNGKKVLLQVVVLLGVAAIAILGSGVITGNSFLKVFSNANSATGTVVEDRFEIEDIKIDGNQLVLVGEKDSLKIVVDDTGMSFYDGAGQMLSAETEDAEFRFKEEAFSNLSIAVTYPGPTMENISRYILVDAGYKHTIDFIVRQDGTLTGVALEGSAIEDIGDAGTPESLKGFYGLFTGRGYAWINSLPILKETLLIGKGPGNFAYYFKQFDYVGLLNTHGSVKQIIDKPHNAYLQYAINLGAPAAIAFFGIFVGALGKAVSLFWKNKKSVSENTVISGAMVSVLGFLIYSVINDSIVTVTPVACMLVGILLAGCYVMEEKK